MRSHCLQPTPTSLKVLLLNLLLLPLLPALAHAATSAEAAAADQRVQRALQLLDRLDAGEYTAAGEHFSDTMHSALGAEMLEQVWTTLPQQVGPALGRDAPRHEKAGPFDVVVVPIRHQAMTLDARVTFGADGRIEGFHVVPSAPPAAPPPGREDAFLEEDFPVGEGMGALPGTLALPRPAAARVRAVVLVHGSGPHDRDETIGPNRPFLDLARGLAAQGIAALRYDKRSKARPQDFADGTYTVDHETVDDAVAAVAALRADARIDPDHVYVVGHSLGAMMAPRIAQRCEVAGLVLLAAPARPLEDVILDQVRHLATLEDDISGEEQAQIAAIGAGVRQVKALGARAPEQRLLLDLPVAYWRDLAGYDPVAALAQLPVPALVVHAGRDFQVTAPDWARWQHAFTGSPRVTLREFPALNHLLIAGDAPSTPKEYFQGGTVDAGVIATIAAWIRTRA